MVAFLVGMAQQPGISSAVGEPVEPTSKLWEKKMYPGAKKVSIFSENPLTRRIPSECLTSFSAKNSENPLTSRIPSECLTSFSAKNSENPLTHRILPVQSLNTEHGIQHTA